MGHYIKYLNIEKKIINLSDHLTGFDNNYQNFLLSGINKKYKGYNVFYGHPLPLQVIKKYMNINFIFDNRDVEHLRWFKKPKGHDLKPILKTKISDFLTCFNGVGHISRILLCSILHKMDLWNNNTCTKNFMTTNDTLSGLVNYYVNGNDEERLYWKFFKSDNPEFLQKIITKDYINGNFHHNFSVIYSAMHSSFLTIISETVGSSYVPFVTEKYIQCIATKNLFLGYAQPLWHDCIVKQHGFKLYTKLFDYKFDCIENPIHRLIQLIEMISKFKHLSNLDLHDLYCLEQDTLDYNYDHYRSKKCIEHYNNYIQNLDYKTAL